jgi:ADP-glucose pyrophosphorylase
VYRMDPVQMIDQHTAWGAGVTVAATGVPRTEATGLGVMQTAPDGHRIEGFLESPPTHRAALATRVRRSRPWASTYSTLTC